jgi:hypothetical protein
MLLRMHPNLHRDPGELASWGATHQGQADVAGKGPLGRACGQCGHWGAADARPPGTKCSVARCAMFQKLTGHGGPRVPRDALACKHFHAVGSEGST